MKADVLNVIPPQRASAIARSAGVVTVQRPLVRRRLPDLRVGQGQERPRTRRRDPDRHRNAQVRPHGEPAREGLRGRGRRAAFGRGAESGAGAQQHVLQLHHRHATSSTSARCTSTTRRRRRVLPVQGAGGLSPAHERTRGTVRVQLGEEHLGGRARLTIASDGAPVVPAFAAEDGRTSRNPLTRPARLPSFPRTRGATCRRRRRRSSRGRR